MTFKWRHPNYYKKLKKNNLTKEDFYDRGEHNEKIQNKNNQAMSKLLQETQRKP